MRQNSFCTVNDYVLGFLPSYYALRLDCLNLRYKGGGLTEIEYLSEVEAFISDLPGATRGRILFILAKQYIKKEVRLTAHFLAGLIGRFGGQVIDFIMECVNRAIKTADCNSKKQGNIRTTAESVTVILDKRGRTATSLYPSRYYA